MKLNSQTKAYLKTLSFSLIVFSFFRLIFYFYFSESAAEFSTADALQAFFIGLRFDLRLSLLTSLPILLIPIYKKAHWANSNVSRKLWASLYSFAFLIICLTYAGDFGYYSYLQSRINSRIFEFIYDIKTSLVMVYESYNIWAWGLALVLATYYTYQALYKYIFTLQNQTLDKKIALFQSLVLGLIVTIGLHGSTSQYPLRWSDAFFTQNSFISNLAMNPIHYIFDTFQYSQKNYDTKKVKEYYPIVAPYLGVQKLDPVNLNFTREIEQSPYFKNKPNIVYIIMESLVAYKTGLFGNHPDSSPELDKLAKFGWNFRHFYTPTEGTARSIFCLVTGVPDINSNSKITSSRNPLIVNQHTLINGLTEYTKHYFIGGNATWGNIRGLLVNNIENLNLFEGDYMDGPRTDVWGLSDLDLFRETAKQLKNYSSEKPFFAAIQTASFHRPYTIPKEHGSFTLKNLSATELKKYGFASNEEYNSFRFSDYSLGEFFKLIKDQAFFKNTIFVIHGDHGLPNYGAEHLSPGYKFFNLNRYHTPLIIYSPLIEEPKEISTIVTEPDILPTLLGITGHNFPNQALGRNVMALSTKTGHRYSFSYVYYSSPLEILLYDDEYLVIGTEEKIDFLHRYNSAESLKDLKADQPEKFKEMSDLLMGLFHTSKYLLHHNQRIK